MPSKRKRRGHGRRSDLAQWIIPMYERPACQFFAWAEPWKLVAYAIYGPATSDPPEELIEELRKVWAELGERILEAHVQYQPGTRPWAWWQFSAPEPMRIVGIDNRISVGFYNGEEIFRTTDDEEEADPIYETERTYLERLGLLTDVERGD